MIEEILKAVFDWDIPFKYFTSANETPDIISLVPNTLYKRVARELNDYIYNGDYDMYTATLQAYHNSPFNCDYIGMLLISPNNFALKKYANKLLSEYKIIKYKEFYVAYGLQK